jgi:predicted Zn-dependent peptidase
VIDVLADQLRNSVLDPAELAREKNVVIEEIKRSADTPEDYVHDVFAETLWSKHPLGRPTIGSVRSVSALTPDDLRAYIATHYTPDRIVVSAAGNASHEEIVGLAADALGDMGGARHTRRPRAPEPSGASRRVRRRTEQVHFCLGCPGYAQGDDDRFALIILDAVLGGSMSSRLFQEIREKRGLAYSIGSYSVSYLEGGAFAVYGGTSLETFDEVLALTRKELDAARSGQLTNEEVSKAKTQLRGAMVLGLENMSTRMMRMGKSLVYLDRVVPLSEVLSKIDAVTSDDVARVASELFAEERMTMAAVGPFRREAEEGSQHAG